MTCVADLAEDFVQHMNDMKHRSSDKEKRLLELSKRLTVILSEWDTKMMLMITKPHVADDQVRLRTIILLSALTYLDTLVHKSFSRLLLRTFISCGFLT